VMSECPEYPWMAAIVRLVLREPRWLQGSMGVVFSGVTFRQGAQPHLAALSLPTS